MNGDVRAYVDAVPAEHRPLVDRVRGLVLGVCPDAVVSISYGSAYTSNCWCGWSAESGQT